MAVTGSRRIVQRSPTVKTAIKRVVTHLPDVSEHVEQAEGVRLLLSHDMRRKMPLLDGTVDSFIHPGKRFEACLVFVTCLT